MVHFCIWREILILSLNTLSVTIAGHIIDIENQQIYDRELEVSNGVIQSIVPKTAVPDQFLLPGFIDAHVHIESSMVVPSEFARMAVVQALLPRFPIHMKLPMSWD